jgi:hypothetical protein
MVFYKYAVSVVTMSTWLHSVLKADGLVAGGHPKLHSATNNRKRRLVG